MKFYIFILFTFLVRFYNLAQSEKEKEYLLALENSSADSSKVRILKQLSVLMLNSNTEKATQYAERCLYLAIKVNDKKSQAGSYNILGSCKLNNGNYVSAMEFYLKSLKLFTELNEKVDITAVYTNIGILNMKEGNLTEARENLKIAIELKEKEKLTKNISGAYLTLASVIYLEKDLDQALIYYEKAAQSAIQNSNLRNLAASLNGIGAIQFKKEKYPESISAYQKALETFEKQEGDNRKAIAGVYHNLASSYRKLGNFDKAIELLNKSLKIAQEIQSNEDIQQAYSGLKDYYKEKGEFEKALTAQENYSAYTDSVVNEKNQEVVSELQEKYKSTIHKKEIHELQKDNSRLEEKSTLQLVLLIVSIGAFFLILLVIFFFWKHLKAKQQQKQLELEQKALRAQMNPHFIFNSLNSIQRMYIDGDEDTANDYMADFSRLLWKILENSGKELIRLKEELEVIDLYMELEILRTDNSFKFTIEIDEDIDPLQVYIPPLIFQPYLENAIWHGIISNTEKGLIKLIIRNYESGKLKCQIIDNGIGFYTGKQQDKKNENESKGMQITAERLGGEQNVVIEELSGGGTCITLFIHYKI